MSGAESVSCHSNANQQPGVELHTKSCMTSTGGSRRAYSNRLTGLCFVRMRTKAEPASQTATLRPSGRAGGRADGRTGVQASERAKPTTSSLAHSLQQINKSFIYLWNYLRGSAESAAAAAAAAESTVELADYSLPDFLTTVRQTDGRTARPVLASLALILLSAQTSAIPSSWHAAPRRAVRSAFRSVGSEVRRRRAV